MIPRRRRERGRTIGPGSLRIIDSKIRKYNNKEKGALTKMGRNVSCKE